MPTTAPLLAGLALRYILHAFSSHLYGVSGYLDLAERALHDGDTGTLREMLAQARAASAAMNDQRAWLSAFAAPERAADIRWCSVNTVVADSVSTLRALSAVCLEVTLCPDLVIEAAMSDAALRQVLFALIMTVPPSMEPRSVSIRTRTAPQGAIIEVKDSAATAISLELARTLLAHSGAQMEVGRAKVPAARIRIPYITTTLARAVGG